MSKQAGFTRRALGLIHAGTGPSDFATPQLGSCG
jgi:hypothetical protein